MKPFWTLTALAVLGALGMGNCAAADVAKEAGPKSRGSRPAFTEIQLTEFLKLYETYLYSGPAGNCDTGSRVCTIEIDLLPVPYQGEIYCLAAVTPELDIPADHKQWKIQWKISEGDFKGKAHFHKKFGVLPLRNDNGQVPSDPKRDDDLTFHIVHKNDKQHSTYTYLPVVVIGDEMGSPEMCASGDPKIVNN